MSEQVIEVWISGIPQPGGSKRAFPFRRKNGSLGVAVSDANPKVHAWREVVAYTFGQRMHDPLDGPVMLEVTFVLPRPAKHYLPVTKKRTEPVLRSDAPSWHTSKPDATKLLRALEDSLKGIAWADDSQVASQAVTKRYSDDGRTGALVRISALP